MSDPYCMFSETLVLDNGIQRKWLEKEIEPVTQSDFDAMPDEEAEKWAEEHDREMEDVINWPEFEWEFVDEGLWMFSDDQGRPYDVALVVQRFLKRFYPEECFALTYAETTSPPDPGGFGGGAMFVTADKIEFMNAHSWADHKVKGSGRKVR